MKLQINNHYLGVLNVTVTEDFKKCEIEGFGLASMSYASNALQKLKEKI